MLQDHLHQIELHVYNVTHNYFTNQDLISQVLWILTSSWVLVMLYSVTGSWVPLSHTLIRYFTNTDILSRYIVKIVTFPIENK